MIRIFFLIVVFCSSAFTRERLNIVYVHIGDLIPTYLWENIRQVRLHNPKETIYLCANSAALEKVQGEIDFYSVRKVSVEHLQHSESHQLFLRTTSFKDPFWIRTTERLLIVDELIASKNLKNIFHIESDVMVYTSFADILPGFIKNYPSIAIPFANDYAAICSIVFFKDKKASKHIAECIARHAPEGINDMRLPGILKEEMGTSIIDHLPILPSVYVQNVSAENFINKWSPDVQDKFVYSKYFEDFRLIFDAATFGTFLSRGCKNSCEGTVFDPRVFDITWEKNSQNLYVPYASFKGDKCKICNLHIHAKNLEEFRSDRSQNPISWINGSMVKYE